MTDIQKTAKPAKVCIRNDNKIKCILSPTVGAQ